LEIRERRLTLFDTESEVSEDEEEYMPDETFADRLVALKDIVPPTYRKHLSNTLSTTSSWVQTTLNYGGKTLWVVSTSVLLLGVPWALAFAEEQQMAEMEREMKMQQSANEVSFATTHPTEGGYVLIRNNSFLLNSNRSSLLCKLLSRLSFFASLLCSCIKNALFLLPCTIIRFGGGGWSR
jgi:import receptor subunit TOM22